MNKNEALDDFKKQTDIKSPEFEHAKAQVLVRCTAAIEHPLEDLRDKISEYIESTKTLSIRLLFLNIILTIATVLATIIAGIPLICKMFRKFFYLFC